MREIISTRFASIIFGFVIILTGGFYLFYAPQVTYLLPSFFPKINFWSYLIGASFIAAGVAILINRPITMYACYLLVILLFAIAVVIDLRGMFNLPDEVRYIYVQYFLKDMGLTTCAVIIANFQRVEKRRHKHHRSRSERL